jgi:hypothetical protein
LTPWAEPQLKLKLCWQQWELMDWQADLQQQRSWELMDWQADLQQQHSWPVSPWANSSVKLQLLVY